MKKRSLYLLAPLFVCAPLFADEAAAAVNAEGAAASNTADVGGLSEAELFVVLGQYMALSGSINELNLSETELERFATGMAGVLVDDTLFGETSDEEIQAAIDDALARLDAVESGAESFEPLQENTPALLGFVVALQASLVGINFSEEEGASIKAGAIEGAAMDDLTPELQMALEPLSELIDARVRAIMAEQQGGEGMPPQADSGSVADQRAAGEAYIAALAEEEEALQQTESGLYYLILEEGSGEKPGSTDTVRVHYHGTLVDGTVFDSSVQRGQPTNFPLNRVVPGFSEGLQLVGEGGKIRLFLPAELGYGNNPPPQSQIPGGAMIIFDCELIAINP